MDTNQPAIDQRVRAAFYGLAVCDALGSPLEFKPRRHDPSKYLREMERNSNFNLPAGHFTDDTSMALCLAISLTESKGKHDAVSQGRLYFEWLKRGYMSSVPGRTFDVGVQTRAVLQHWRYPPFDNTLAKIDKEFNEERCCGNGSLMRCLPCGLAAVDESDAYELGRQSSLVTHPHARCVDACGIYSVLVFNALKGANKEELLQKLLTYLAKDGIDDELRVRLKTYTSLDTFASQRRADISSSGYVLDSLEAALWTFFVTDTFEQGAIEVVNLGNDADTVGAIYGGLAGAFYGSVDSVPSRWLSKMKQMKLVDDAVDGLLGLHRDRIGAAKASESEPGSIT